MSSDSDSSDNELMKNLLASADTNLFTENLYKKKNQKNINSTTDDIQPIISKSVPTNIKPKSERYLDVEENGLDKELNIPKSMQNHFAKKLSEFIDQQIEFVDEDTLNRKKYKRKVKDCTKLLSLLDEPIRLGTKDDFEYPKCKPQLKRRLLDDENELDNESKIKSVAIDGYFILNQIDCKNWIDRKKSKVYKYKSKIGNPYQYVEDDNEFSKLKKKNCWSYKKIARNKIKIKG